MICVLSFVVFSILGIFSAKYRELSMEAFECLKSTFKNEPCETGLDDRVQATVVGKVLDYSPRLGKLLNNHFQAFSWIMVIILVISGFLAAEGVYNYIVYGNCNGPEAVVGCSINQAEQFFDIQKFSEVLGLEAKIS